MERVAFFRGSESDIFGQKLDKLNFVQVQIIIIVKLLSIALIDTNAGIEKLGQ